MKQSATVRSAVFITIRFFSPVKLKAPAADIKAAVLWTDGYSSALRTFFMIAKLTFASFVWTAAAHKNRLTMAPPSFLGAGYFAWSRDDRKSQSSSNAVQFIDRVIRLDENGEPWTLTAYQRRVSHTRNMHLIRNQVLAAKYPKSKSYFCIVRVLSELLEHA